MKPLSAITLVLALSLGASPTAAQRPDPVKWTLSLEAESAPPGAHVLARLTATLDPGWHLYSLTTPPDGPIPTAIGLVDEEAVAGFAIHQPRPVTKFDPNFKLDTETYDKQVTFLIDVALADIAAPGPVELAAEVRYQVCTDKLCLPPVRRTVAATLLVDPAASAPPVSIPAGFLVAGGAGTPAPGPVPAAPMASDADQQGMIAFLLAAFGFGVAAVFTPCVFPLIPITISIFLNQKTASRRDGVIQATVFCLGIIVLFSSLGLAVTAALGPFGVVQLGSSPWVNSFIALVFLAFGLSLLGAFEIRLPSIVLTRLDRASQRGGFAGTLLMGLSFSLAAFACVGPFVGALLAASIQGGGLKPLLGMVVFATGLASPFFLLVLFPSYLQRLPKAGSWMVRVKVVLGFVILAAMFKYWSNVDQVMQWGLLGRERFLAVWIVLFSVAGLYLLGLLRIEGADPDERLGLGRLFAGAAFLVLAVSLLPGMFGGRLGELDAYVPPAGDGGVSTLSGSAGGGPAWMRNQYPEALLKAKEEGKLVLVNFTGYACTNCHWMKANMFPRPAIAEALERFVLVELYTDGVDEASQSNQQLQEQKFSTIAIPYYAILNPDESVLATFAGLTRDPEEFLAFLNTSAR